MTGPLDGNGTGDGAVACAAPAGCRQAAADGTPWCGAHGAPRGGGLPAAIADALPLIGAVRAEAKDARAWDARMSDAVKEWMAAHGEDEISHEGYRARLVRRRRPATWDLASLTPDALAAIARVPGLLRVDTVLLGKLGDAHEVVALRDVRVRGEETAAALVVERERAAAGG